MIVVLVIQEKQPLVEQTCGLEAINSGIRINRSVQPDEALKSTYRVLIVFVQ